MTKQPADTLPKPLKFDTKTLKDGPDTTRRTTSGQYALYITQ